jgi:hypothetical protein
MTIALPYTPTDPSFRTWLQYARDRALTTWVHYRVAESAAHVASGEGPRNRSHWQAIKPTTRPYLGRIRSGRGLPDLH